jgi:hypothetical protein
LAKSQERNDKEILAGFLISTIGHYSDLRGQRANQDKMALNGSHATFGPINKSSRGQIRQADPNSPKCSLPTQKLNIDNNVRFRYQTWYWFGLLDVSIYRARDDADTQLTVFDSSALEKQFPIFWPKRLTRLRRTRDYIIVSDELRYDGDSNN